MNGSNIPRVFRIIDSVEKTALRLSFALGLKSAVLAHNETDLVRSTAHGDMEANMTTIYNIRPPLSAFDDITLHLSQRHTTMTNDKDRHRQEMARTQ